MAGHPAGELTHQQVQRPCVWGAGRHRWEWGECQEVRSKRHGLWMVRNLRFCTKWTAPEGQYPGHFWIGSGALGWEVAACLGRVEEVVRSGLEEVEPKGRTSGWM